MAIQQHPLPQDISSYRFRLIGDMTIKQFGMLAGGIIGAIIIYSSPIPFFFKYPLAFVALAIGIGSAFVPIQGRPLDQWIIAFIKSIYSPTQYVWRQSADKDDAQTLIVKPTTVQEQIKTQYPTLQVNQNPPAPSAPPINQAAAPETPKEETISTPTTPTSPKEEAPVVSKTKTTPIEEPSQPNTTPTPPPQSDTSPSPAPTPQPQPQATQAAPTTTLPIPFTPTTPNTLVGLTLTPDGKILDNVLVEVLSQGLTIRATKSNRLGQFMFARPLENGLYQLSADKEGFKFTAYSLELKGDIVRPLKIQAET